MDDSPIYYLTQFIDAIRANKPNDKSDLDRKYAILLTELEKILAYYEYWLSER